MISKYPLYLLTSIILLNFVPLYVEAQDSVTLSVSPTIFDLSAEPGQEWRSTLKIINVNKFDLTVYADVVNFFPKGEGGDGRFVAVDSSETDGSSLAEWFSISHDPIVIPREQTFELPFSVKVPEGASPGGHYAAILIGTKPPVGKGEKTKLQTAQVVSSLFFTKVAGDIIESGLIREFTTTKSILSSPEATFTLRFENKGNVQLQPQGEIKIYNMWGEERGVIPINQYSNFSYVLRESIKRFSLSWKGEWSAADIGRYTAEATLGYGTDNRQFTSAKTYFWVLPFKLLFGVISGLVVFFGTLIWLVRIYVKHMLKLNGINIANYQTLQANTNQITPKTRTKIITPVQESILDLSKRMKTKATLFSKFKELLDFIFHFRLFFLAILSTLLFIILLLLYIKSAHTEYRAYEVSYLQNDNVTSTINSEEIIYKQLLISEHINPADFKEQKSAEIGVVNRSGVPGAGARVKLQLEKEGYLVNKLEANFTEVQEGTAIISSTSNLETAVELSKLLKSALVSVSEDSTDPTITIFVGGDLSK